MRTFFRQGGRQRIQGREAVVEQTLAFRANAMRAKTAIVDFRPGIVVLAGGIVQAAIVISVRNERIVRYEVVADPQRLHVLNVDPAK